MALFIRSVKSTQITCQRMSKGEGTKVDKRGYRRYRSIIRNSKIGYARHRSSEPQKESLSVWTSFSLYPHRRREIATATFHATDEKTVSRNPMNVMNGTSHCAYIYISSLATVGFHRRCYTLRSFTGRGRNAARLRLRTIQLYIS